ncbi:hypothetical protein BDR03DRAFT_1011030 [Suillus americanus]|nr:hypothetical protein BDR03DRAFT_1011030 [Suillus americanus]
MFVCSDVPPFKLSQSGALAHSAWNTRGWTRVVLESYEELNKYLATIESCAADARAGFQRIPWPLLCKSQHHFLLHSLKAYSLLLHPPSAFILAQAALMTPPILITQPQCPSKQPSNERGGELWTKEELGISVFNTKDGAHAVAFKRVSD